MDAFIHQQPSEEAEMIAGDEAWLTALSRHLIALLGGGRSRLLLYLEMADGWSRGGIYVDEGNRIAFFALQRDLYASVYHSWEQLEDDKLWSVFRLLLAEDGTFAASFLFPDQVDIGDIGDDNGRSIAAAREAFGEKPIYYPPAPPHSFDLSEETHGLENPLG